MIQVKLGNNLQRSTVIVDSNATIRSVLEDAGIDYGAGITTLNGSTLRPGDFEKTFDDFGIKEDCMLYSVRKADNA